MLTGSRQQNKQKTSRKRRLATMAILSDEQSDKESEEDDGQPISADGQPISADTVVDIVGKIHLKFAPAQFAANVAAKPDGSRKRSCPCCGCYSGCASLTCMNRPACSYAYKRPKQNTTVAHVYEPDPGTIEMQAQTALAVDSNYQMSVARLKRVYLDLVPVKQLQAAFLLLNSPPETLNHYCFDNTTSASRLHCLPARILQAVLSHPHGLSPAFAKLYEDQRIRGVWFREATKTQVKAGIKHCHETHPEHFPDGEDTVYGIIVPSDHAAIRAILSCATANMFYSMINIPLPGLKIIKLN